MDLAPTYGSSLANSSFEQPQTRTTHIGVIARPSSATTTYNRSCTISGVNDGLSQRFVFSKSPKRAVESMQTKTNCRTLIVAEAGVNHNGDLTAAEKLIEAAANAGADLVKFQTFRAESLVTALAPKADYQIVNARDDFGQKTMLKRLELSYQIHTELIAHCRSKKIGFFSTAFDLESLDMLEKLGLNLFKVPSGEITNLPYLRRVGSFGKPTIVSTGMANIDEIHAAISVLSAAGLTKEQITLLHCTTEYPAPMSEVNLQAIVSIKV